MSTPPALGATIGAQAVGEPRTSPVEPRTTGRRDAEPVRADSCTPPPAPPPPAMSTAELTVLEHLRDRLMHIGDTELAAGRERVQAETLTKALAALRAPTPHQDTEARHKVCEAMGISRAQTNDYMLECVEILVAEHRAMKAAAGAPSTPPPALGEPPSDIVAAALRAAAHSPCRSKRGAAAFTAYGLIVAGFNHRTDGCPGTAECKATCRHTAIHAEQDVILRAGPTRLNGAEMLHVKSVDGALVPSGGPSCVQCSKFILHAGIDAVWLYHEHGWRRYEAHEFHRLSLAATPPLSAPPADLVALVVEMQRRRRALDNQSGLSVAAYSRAVDDLLAWTPPALGTPLAAEAATEPANPRKTAWAVVEKAVADGDVEETLNALAAWLVVDAEQESHELVKSLLLGAAEHVRDAAFDFYASTK